MYRACVKDNLLIDDIFEYVAESFLRRGGNTAMGISAVASIGQINKTADVKPGTSSSSTASSASAASTTPPAGASSATNDTNEAFKVTGGPSKQRTGGKKASLCVVQ